MGTDHAPMPDVPADVAELAKRLELAWNNATPHGRDLLGWWMNTAIDDFTATAPKMVEYGGTNEGSADLQLIGENLATLLGMHDAPDAVKQELGCWFYMQGKVARLVSDYQQHRPGKSDTWFDAGIYAMMARRIQEVGRWP